jgi:hypothetical protein
VAQFQRLYVSLAYCRKFRIAVDGNENIQEVLDAVGYPKYFLELIRIPGIFRRI